MSMILKDNFPPDVWCLTRMEDCDEFVRFSLVLPYGTDWGGVHSGRMIYLIMSRTSQFCDNISEQHSQQQRIPPFSLAAKSIETFILLLYPVFRLRLFVLCSFVFRILEPLRVSEYCVLSHFCHLNHAPSSNLWPVSALSVRSVGLVALSTNSQTNIYDEIFRIIAPDLDQILNDIVSTGKQCDVFCNILSIFVDTHMKLLSSEWRLLCDQYTCYIM